MAPASAEPRSATSPIDITGAVTREYLHHHRVCPDRLDESGQLMIAVTHGSSLEAISELEDLFGVRTITRLVEPGALDRMIERLATAGTDDAPANGAEEIGESDVREIVNQPPVIRYVNLLLRDAHGASASDIHLDASRNGMRARVRVDGVLIPALDPPRSLQDAVVSRLKLLAELDIAEKRRPQDGRLRIRLEETELDLRVSTVPTMHGESVVLRLLDGSNRPVDLTSLGMPQAVLERVIAETGRSHGMLLVTGPTGSGKTTTLYGALRRRNVHSEKIITVEDPVEYQLDGVTQVPVHRQAGVTFASALRSILRQDPDVIMIGEMRDPETADIAVQAAMTGHLVFSTLHTNDAPSAIPRLADLGVSPYLIAGTVTAVIAQRLLRKLCTSCARPAKADVRKLEAVTGEADALLASIADSDEWMNAVGCDACRGTGYRGRVGVFECVRVSQELREAIAAESTYDHLRMVAIRNGYAPMSHDGLVKASRGMTTIDEVIRVAHE